MKWYQRLPFPSTEPSQFWGPTSSELLSLTWELKCALKGHLIFEFNIPHTLTFHLGDVKYANAFNFMYVCMYVCPITFSTMVESWGPHVKREDNHYFDSNYAFSIYLINWTLKVANVWKCAQSTPRFFPLHLKASSSHKRCFCQLERPSTICLQTQPFAIQIKKPCILKDWESLLPWASPKVLGLHLWATIFEAKTLTLRDALGSKVPLYLPIGSLIHTSQFFYMANE
jgi:hypothetical protein